MNNKGRGRNLLLMKSSSTVLIAGVLFQLLIVVLFYMNLQPHILRLMPDDSFYYLKIAQNIGNNLGSVFSPGEPTNGYHPLWMGILILIQYSLRPGNGFFILSVLLLSVAFNAFTALILRRFLKMLGFAEEQQTLGIVLYLFLPWLVLLTLSGLETPLFFMCLLSFFIMLQKVITSDSDRIREYVLLGISAGLLFLSRTDSVFFIVTGAVILLLRKRTLTALRNLLVTSIVTTLISLPWLLWCQIRFGSPLQSSGLALSYLRWHTMYPVDTLKYWILNAGRLFHKLAIMFISPFVYHARDFETIIPIWCDVLMFLIAAGTVYYLLRKRKDIILPAYIWLSAVLLLVFYTFVRIASAVWHMSVFALILLLIILNITRYIRHKSWTLAAFILTCLAINIYTLGNGFYYPQQVTDMITCAQSIGNESDGILNVGTTDAGYMGYFSRHVVVNLDGVVNQRAFEHIRDGTFGEYLYELDLDFVNVSPERLEFYCRNGILYQ